MRTMKLVLLVMALAAVSFAQGSADVGVGADVAVHAGRGAASAAQVGFDNYMTMTARHCADYVTKGNAFLKAITFGHYGQGGIDVVGCNADPSTVFRTETKHNLVTDAGFDQSTSALANTATQAAACNYIAVTNTAITPAAGDTTLSGEISTNGLGRAQATYAHTGGTKIFTLTKTFTASGTQASQASGVFNASSSGSLCYEATYSSVTVNNTDTLTVTWTVTLS